MRWGIGAKRLLIAGVVAAGVNGAALAQSADALRGQRLYENACIRCHGETVHDRKQRAATSLDDVRSYVRRWSGLLGMPWTNDEIEDVTLYLNERFYRFEEPGRRS